MARAEQVQFNVRSTFARARAQELARLTGLTVTQVVEDALRGYTPPAMDAPAGRLVRRGPILVMPAGSGTLSFAEAEAELNASRERDLED